MPKLVQDIAQFMPFQFLIYFPIQLILGRFAPDQIAGGFLIGSLWLLAGLGLFALVWRQGIKRFSAVGA
jgi:ABC-2 type transport system permease protein